MTIRKSVFLEELRRAFSPGRFSLVLILSAGVFLIGYWSISWIPEERSWIDLWYAIYNQSFFLQILPLVAAVPFADSLAADRSQGYFDQLVVRASYRKVMSAKMAANALVGGFSGAFPLVILFIAARILQPVTSHPLNAAVIEQYAVRPLEGFLQPIYFQNPHIFVLIVLCLVFLVGAAYATLGLCSSFLINNRFLAFGSPFVLFIFLQYFSERTRLLDWYWSPINSLLSYPRGELINQIRDIPLLFFNPVMILCLSIGIFFLFGQRQRVLEFHKSTPDWLEKIRAVLIPLLYSNRRRKTASDHQLKPGQSKPWLNYFRLQMRMNFLRWQWLLVIPVTILMAIIISRFMLLDTVSRMTFFTYAEGENALAPVNVWDVFFVIFGNPYTMGFVLVNLFLFLVNDLQPETGFGQLALFRLRSRYQSWMAKIAALFCLACIYVLGCMAIIILVSAFTLPVEWEWSQLALTYCQGINLPPLFTRQYGLFQGLGLVSSLVILGFFCLGCLVMLINSITHRRFTGYLLVESLILSSIGLSSMLVSGHHWQLVLPVIRNLVLNMVPFLERHYPIWISFVHWLVWLLVLIPIGIRLLRRQDHLSNSLP